MELKGKRINFLGDSITEGHGTTCKENCFVSLLKDKLELAESRNYGIGGTRFAVQLHRSAELRWDQDFCSRVADMDPDADVVVVFGGTNDFGHGDAPLGCREDRTPETFWGACHTLMRSLIEKYPEAAIVVLTPLHRLNEDNVRGDGFKNADVAPLSTYVEIIKEAACWYSLPVLDLFAVSGMQPRVPVIQEKYVPDGLHPNDAGHVILADKIAAFLKQL